MKTRIYATPAVKGLKPLYGRAAKQYQWGLYWVIPCTIAIRILRITWQAIFHLHAESVITHQSLPITYHAYVDS